MAVQEVFRTNLLNAIQKHPLPTATICARAGYDPGYVRKVCAGKANPTILFADCMARAVGLEITDLFKREVT